MKTYSELRAEGRKALQGKWNESMLAFLPVVVITIILVGLNAWLQNVMGDASAIATLGKQAVELLFALLIILVVMPLNFGFAMAMWKKVKGENSVAIQDVWAGAKQNYGFSIGYALAISGIGAAIGLVLVIVYVVALVILISALGISNFSTETIEAITNQPALLFTSVGTPMLAIILSFIVLYLAILIISMWFAYMYTMSMFIRMDNPTIGVIAAMKASRKMMYGHKWQLFVLGLTFIGWGILATLTFGIGLLWLYPYTTATQAAFYEEIKPQNESITPSTNKE